MDDVRPGRREQLPKLRMPARNAKAFCELARHERLSVACCHKSRPADSADLQGMLVRHLPAPDDCRSDHPLAL
jgi:hypothetical protein